MSIIIPAKCESKCLATSLAYLSEARLQSDLSFEIVVVVPADDRDTYEVATAMADKVVTENAGRRYTIGAARNLGAASAKGSYLFHTDADVIVTRLRCFLDIMQRELGKPEVVGLTGPVMPYPSESSWLDYVMHRILNAHFRLSHLYGAAFMRGECQAVRSDAFQAVNGYDEQYTSGEDCDLSRRLRRLGRTRYLPALCVYHSPRRFRQKGYALVIAVYLREWVWMKAFRRSYVKEWEIVR